VALHRAPGVPGDLEDHAGDREADQRVRGLEPEADRGGARDDREARVGVGAGVLAVCDERRAVAASCRLPVYMKTTTIRVPSETRDRLNELARRRGAPAGEVVAALVQEADDRALLAAAQEGWERMSADPAALETYRAEGRDLEGFDRPLPDY
jgi:predicted DNA-binding protein